MDFNQVRYFLALAETLNFTRAAERCHVSQPALTQAIQRLEDSLNGKLIVRDRNATQLTELGITVRQHFEKIDYTRRLVVETARGMANDEDAELNIGVVCTLGSRCLMPISEGFQSTVNPPTLTLHEVTPDAWPKLLKSEALDGVFCELSPSDTESIECHPLFKEHVGVAFSNNHPLAMSDGPVGIKEVFQHPYIDRLNCEFRENILQLSERDNLPINVVCRSEREDWVQRLVAEGTGVSIIPEYSVTSNQVKVRRLSEPELSRNVGFATLRNTNQKPNLFKLIEIIRQVDWE